MGPLAHRIEEGDPRAEARLVEAYAHRIRALALHRAPPEWADDLVQEVLVRVIVAFREGALRNRRKEANFVLGVARNVILDWHRRDGRRGEVPLRSIAPRSMPSETCAPLDRLLKREAMAEVAACLRELAVEDRRVLYLAYVEDLKPREIAERLETTPKAVRQRKWRALKRFEAHWRERRAQADGHLA